MVVTNRSVLRDARAFMQMISLGLTFGLHLDSLASFYAGNPKHPGANAETGLRPPRISGGLS